MEIFQKRFIQAKEASDLRWVDIAKRSGLSKASISQYKNGVHVPEPDALYRLAAVLNVSMEWLTGADTEKVEVRDTVILRRFDQLNEAGKAEFMRFLDVLSQDERYKR